VARGKARGLVGQDAGRWGAGPGPGPALRSAAVEEAAPHRGPTRLEHDSLGPVAVPVAARWGAQTQRAVENFAISGEPMPAAVIRALATVKAAAAEVNAQLGVLDAPVAEAVAAAAREVASGAHAGEFPVDVFQTGSGTSTNMNVNEVVAHLASERLGRPVHPNDEVNASQSSNDVVPTAVHVAVLAALGRDLLPALEGLASTLRRRAGELSGVVKAGRTHLVDAAPVTLGQELAGYATAVEHGLDRLRGCRGRLGELALGGSAVGTGLNVPAGFAAAVVARVAAATGLELVEAPDHFEAQGGRDALVEVSGALRTVAVSLVRVANDLRWMASGPATGLGEVRLPALQPGSSIMPGKVNPVLCEVLVQVGAQVVGNDAAVAFAGASGAFELTTAVPVMARNVLASIGLLASAARTFDERCVAGLGADVERCRRLAESSPAVATALAPRLGYERVAGLVRRAVAEGRPVVEVVAEELPEEAEALVALLDVEGMVGGAGGA